MALLSGRVYSDVGVPSNTFGTEGDIYMQLDGLKTTYRKEGGAWNAFGNQLGTIPEFLKGVGIPSNAVGTDNQYYRDVNTDDIYEKQAGFWVNIASWTSLELQQQLEKNGVGADLAVTNHVANIDTFIGAGDEGFFDGSTTGTKPSIKGLVKVWRENDTNVYQKAQTDSNKWANRSTSNGGSTWTPWRTVADENGDASRRFKAAQGVDNNDVVVMSQLLSAYGLTAVTVVPSGQTEGLLLGPYQRVRVQLLGSAGEGGQGNNGTYGASGEASTVRYPDTTLIFSAGGGFGGEGADDSGGGYGGGAHGQKGVLSMNRTHSLRTWCLSENLSLAHDSFPLTSVGSAGHPPYPNTVAGGTGGEGAYADIVYYNPTNGNIALEVYAGATQFGTGGHAVIFKEV